MLRLLRKALGMATAVLVTTAALSAAPLFPDVPDNHWAKDAVAALAAKGLVEGYPDGTFKGDRSASRWETAMIVARLLSKMDQAHATFATKAELGAVRELADALKEELGALGVRVENLEDQTELIDLRVSELERIRFYGRVHFVGVSQNIKSDATSLGTAANPAIDWSTGRLLTEGTGMTSLGVLGLNADVSEDLVAGAELVAFASQGDRLIDAYWGISAPYLSNPWTTQGSTNPGAQPDNHTPFTRMALDNFWLHHKPTGTKVTVGSYFNKYAPDFVINGARNPNIHQPRWLPFYGANVHGSIAGKESGWKYEAFYTKLPELSTYESHSFGGTVRHEFPKERGHASMTFARTQNERIADGVLRGVAGPQIALPAVPFTGPGAAPEATDAWLDNRGVNPLVRRFVGPQAQNTWGLDFDYQLMQESNVRIFGEYATSDYDPDTSDIFFNTSVTGAMFRFGVSAQPTEGLDLALEYLSVDPTYDPFIAAYPIPPGIPVFLPYGSYYSSYYQLHDYLNYPNNREGFKFSGSYLFNEDRTRVFATYQSLEQKAATTPSQVQTVGNIEPLFPQLQAVGASAKGKLDSFGLGVSHRWNDKLVTDFAYYNYDLSRAGAPVDTISLAQDVYKFAAEYKFDKQWDIRANFYHLDYSGRAGLLNTNFSQTIPGIGLDWNLAENTTVSLDYRLFDLRDKAVPRNSFQGDQVQMEMKVDF